MASRDWQRAAFDALRGSADPLYTFAYGRLKWLIGEGRISECAEWLTEVDCLSRCHAQRLTQRLPGMIMEDYIIAQVGPTSATRTIRVQRWGWSLGGGGFPNWPAMLADCSRSPNALASATQAIIRDIEKRVPMPSVAY